MSASTSDPVSRKYFLTGTSALGIFRQSLGRASAPVAQDFSAPDFEKFVRRPTSENCFLTETEKKSSRFH